MLVTNRAHVAKASRRPPATRGRHVCVYACSLQGAKAHSVLNNLSEATSFQMLTRRSVVAMMAVAFAAPTIIGNDAVANAASIDILEDQKGIGSRGARRGDLLLFHYVGRLEATGQVFDSTRGGLAYRDGGPGVLRPAAVALGGGPVPGICEGLQQVELLRLSAVGPDQLTKGISKCGAGGANQQAENCTNISYQEFL
ncbi:hypothetical protein PLESTB_001368400 [Pleodorina starrii]|uniref:peptidylprolyl isomerase n=1 Tax=Pleodorina starrii TaxID=330485 RepID=A0A9W6BVX5_9CHLO|nr:hypothetical protein PLESTB_001368400 [Pleodorina starrii]